MDVVRAWTPRKRELFKMDHAKAAWARLSEQGWLDDC